MKWFAAFFLCVSFVFLAVFGVNCIYGILFPIRFQDEVRLASEESGVDQAIIFSMINIESQFCADVVSPKGAVGLMQVMPSTAKSLAENENPSIKDSADDEFTLNLTDPATNIHYGTLYIKKLIARFGNLETALCAYNAGPTNVAGWLKNQEYSEDGKTLKKIPFSETKNYVKKFQRSFKYYSKKV